MSKRKLFIDTIFLSAIIISITYNVYRHFVDGFVLTWNFYAGIIIIMLGIFYFVIKPRSENYLVLVLLILATPSLINFTAEIVNGDIVEISDGSNYNTLGFNFFIFFFLLLYCGLNYRIIKTLFKNTDSETLEKEEKMVSFYYTQFMEENDVQLSMAIEKLNEYPHEAQVALLKIREERAI